jgi:hypothetical protein
LRFDLLLLRHCAGRVVLVDDCIGGDAGTIKTLIGTFGEM